MNSRERVTKALNHQVPDKVPVDLGGFVTTIEAEAYEDLKKHLGMKKETIVSVRAHVVPDEEILEKFEVDTRYLRPFPVQRWEDVKKVNPVVDAWGIKFYRPASSHYFDPVEYPLAEATLEDLKNYKYPDQWDEEYGRDLAETAERLSRETDYFLIADGINGIFEKTWFLRGLENFMVDLALNKDLVARLLDIVLEQLMDFYDKFLGVVGPYAGMVMITDDLGGQGGLLISPGLYRELIKPRQKELYSFIKSKTNAKLFLHSCGAIRELIDDLIEIGVDVLNPIQVSAKGMDTKELKSDFGDRIAFWGGGIDTQRVLPFGTPGEVDAEVKKRMSDLKPGGGFVFTQIHEIQPETPPENIIAMYEAVKKYRNY
ncbi:uroporphyrinogen decarboxylase family protein [Chloroflexota bacterium]